MRPAERRIEVAGLGLNYGDGGAPDRPTLLLLHGLAARWQVFGPLLPHLVDDWHVIAPDLRGHGTSDRAVDGYRIPQFTADVRGLLAEVEPDGGPVFVYGHSLGGWIGLCLAAELPDAVRGLVVADTAIYPEHIDPDYAVSYLADLPIAMRSMAKSLKQLDGAVMDAFRSGELLDGYDPDDVLPRVRCPVLLLQADPACNGLMNDADVEHARDLLPGLRHVRFDGVGHALHVEDAPAVHRAVAPFLEECAAPG